MKRGYGEALNEAMNDSMDAAARMIQDRHLHLQDIAQLYAIALSDPRTPRPCMLALEGALAERSIYNERKLVTDAGVLTLHTDKINSSGDPRYALDRTCRMCNDMGGKLEKDRALHLHELKLIQKLCKKTPALRAAIDEMVKARSINNSKRRATDASMRADARMRISRALAQ